MVLGAGSWILGAGCWVLGSRQPKESLHPKPLSCKRLTLNPSPGGEGLKELTTYVILPPPRPWERGIRGGEAKHQGQGIGFKVLTRR